MASQQSPISYSDNPDDIALDLYSLLCEEFQWRVEDNPPPNNPDSGFYERLRAQLLASATAHIESLSEETTPVDIPDLFDIACPANDALWGDLYGPQPAQPTVQPMTQTPTLPPAPLPQPSRSVFLVSSIILTSTDSEGRAEEIYNGMMHSFPSDTARQAAVEQREYSLRFAANIRANVQRPGEVVDTASMAQSLFPADDPVWTMEDSPATDLDSTPAGYHRDDRVDSAVPTVGWHSDAHPPMSALRSTLSPSTSSTDTSYLTSSSNTYSDDISDDSDDYTRYIRHRYHPLAHSRHEPYGPAGIVRDPDDPTGSDRLSRAYTGERVYCECEDNLLSDRDYEMPTRVRQDRRRWAQSLEQHIQYFIARSYTGLVTRQDVEELRSRWCTWLARQDWEDNHPLSGHAARRFYSRYEWNGLGDEIGMMRIREQMREAQLH